MQKIIRPLYFVGICVMMLVTATLLVWYFTGISLGATTSDKQGNVINHQKNFDFFVATTTNATSTAAATPEMLDLKNAKKVTLYFQRGDTTGQGNVGTTTFTVQVSPDGTNWYTFNKLVQNLATTTTPTTLNKWIASASLPYNNATSTTILSLDLEHDTFQYLRCNAWEVTDGEHTCSATVEY